MPCRCPAAALPLLWRAAPNRGAAAGGGFRPVRIRRGFASARRLGEGGGSVTRCRPVRRARWAAGAAAM